MNNGQNIYDNDQFFAKYQELRERENNYNNLLEQPAIRNLLPDLTGMSVLDLGCGYGGNCADFMRRGASSVVGIDLSEKMLEVAWSKNAQPGVEYRRLDMEDLHKLSGTFDLVFSSLAMHYVEDFPRLLGNVNSLLSANGLLIFSQEHPLVTAPMTGPQWINGEHPVQASYCLSDYLRPGERTHNWFDHGVRKYHRSFSEIIDALCGSGFVLEQAVKPLPDEAAVKLIPGLAKEIHAPCFLLIEARKR